MARRKKEHPRKKWIVEAAARKGLSLDEVAERAGISRQTLYRLRDGAPAYAKTLRNVEAIFDWAPGSLEAIDAGGEPTVVDVDAVLARPPVALLSPAADPRQQLRAIREQLGPAAFWMEIGLMDAEERGEAIG